MRCCIIRGWFFFFFFLIKQFVDDFLQSILFFLDNWPICGESQSKHSDVILTLRIHPVKTNFSSAFSPLERNGIWLLTRPSNMYFSSWYVFSVLHISIFVLICVFFRPQMRIPSSYMYIPTANMHFSSSKICVLILQIYFSSLKMYYPPFSSFFILQICIFVPKYININLAYRHRVFGIVQ